MGKPSSAWEDFELDSALEREMLARALPIVPVASDGSIRVFIDLAEGRVDATVSPPAARVFASTSDALGASGPSCIRLLRIRPLLVGAAWKVLDLIIETALDEAGVTRSGKSPWRSIERKQAHAFRWPRRTRPLNKDVWDSLMGVYVNTVDLRHSLIHRRAFVNGATDELVGTDKFGQPIAAMLPGEQEAFARAVLLASELLTTDPSDQRLLTAIRFELGRMQRVHQHRIAHVSAVESPREVIVTIGPDPSDPTHYLLDIPTIKNHGALNGAPWVDLTVNIRDRPGQALRARLEDAPDSAVSIDPDFPPDWLQVPS